MIIALIGSHGTGKTTVFERLRQEVPNAQFFTEQVRHQLPKFGYDNPYTLIQQNGIAAFELMNINSWSVIDPDANTTLDERRIITERSAIDNYAYYLTLRESKFDYEAETVLRNMARYYASLVDLFIYFPVGKIPLTADKMRKDDIDYQHAVDKNIRKTLKDFGIGGDRVYHIQSKDIDRRMQEVLDVLGISNSDILLSFYTQPQSLALLGV
jgi:nicotinamide riboside kinase